MPDFFHVCRVQPPTPGVLPPPTVGGTLDVVATAPTLAPGSDEELRRLFPRGVTSHGQQYLTGWPAQDNQAPAMWAVEAFFEAVRLAEHRDCPSRFESIFAFETEADARAFVGSYRLGFPSAIYRVRGEARHRANMPLLKLVGVPVSHAFALARHYWRGERGPAAELWEVLLAPPVEVVELVDANVL
jgi:hypothetical protein